MAYKYLIYGSLGLILEVFWTGIGSLLKGDIKLTSSTSIWMFFIYGFACFIEPISDSLSSFPIVFRGVIYVVCIFAAEYLVGSLMKMLNACPWDYSDAKYNIKGIIRLDYAPVWFALGLVFEFVHKRMA